MDEAGFWKIIETAHRLSRGQMEEKCAQLRSQLAELDDPELLDFSRHFQAMDAAAYTWPLWGAAFVMCGGCSDDSFSDFRATLISMGRRTYERALADPDSLAAVRFDDDDPCYEGYQYVPTEVIESRLGSMPDRQVSLPAAPAGEEWDEDTVGGLYPRLAKRYSWPSPGGKKPWWKFW